MEIGNKVVIKKQQTEDNIKILKQNNIKPYKQVGKIINIIKKESLKDGDIKYLLIDFGNNVIINILQDYVELETIAILNNMMDNYAKECSDGKYQTADELSTDKYIKQFMDMLGMNKKK